VVIRTIVAVAFLVACVVVMNKVYWMLEMCVPTSQEEKAKARARRWKGAVAAVVAGAWLCGACIAFGLGMPKVLHAVVFAGPVAISFPVLVWVLLAY
jgi:predicted Co/Zn/Cd cation transporter (cation efflux family)